jgi:hypothetical protein
MSPLASVSEPRRPTLKKVEKGRVLVPIECVPEWAKGQHPGGLRIVPLHWKRPLDPLPSNHWLDCWYLWNPEVEVTNWQFNPQTVLDGKIEDEEDRFRLELLIFPADWDTQTKSHRLHCPGLLHSLALKGQGAVWVVPERDGSISIWADSTFGLYHGRV